jgi:hypothetical protein
MRIGENPDTVDQLPARNVRHRRPAGPPTLLAYSVSLEWDRDPGETQIVVADSGSSSVLMLPVTGENAGEALRHPFRYAP